MKVDMSAQGVTVRLKRVSQLRRLCLSLGKAGSREHGNRASMTTGKLVYWQEEKMWIGYMEEYPDYITQGESLEELKENLKDLNKELRKKDRCED